MILEQKELNSFKFFFGDKCDDCVKELKVNYLKTISKISAGCEFVFKIQAIY